jgi:hypothetical protein
MGRDPPAGGAAAGHRGWRARARADAARRNGTEGAGHAYHPAGYALHSLPLRPSSGGDQLTNPVTDPTVKIPEYKACAATVERLDAPVVEEMRPATENFTPETAPKLFPYVVGETTAPPEKSGKAY